MSTAEQLQALFREAKSVVFLTGAGVSASAGVATFQQTDREWPHATSRAEVMSLPFFLQEPEEFWRLYPSLFKGVGTLEPTRFHRAVAALSERWEVTVVTQNVDGLHSRAGSPRVLEVHGNCSRAVCLKCWHSEELPPVLDGSVRSCPSCSFPLKPDVSLFLEGVQHMGEARELTQEADLWVVAGTSLMVGPVNELPSFTEVFGTPTVWVNPCRPPAGFFFKDQWLKTSDEFAQEVLEPLLGEGV